MSKLSGYMVSVIVLVFLCTILGINTESSLVNFLMNPTSYSDTKLYVAIGVMVGLFVIAGAVSYFVSGSDKLDFVALANTGFIAFFLGMANEILSIFLAISGGVGEVTFRLIIAAFFISPMFYLYVMAIVEWWRGVG